MENTKSNLNESPSEIKDSEYALWNYLSGKVEHLYDYYDLSEESN